MPESLRFIAEYGAKKSPVVIGFARDKYDDLTAMQVIHLDPKTGAKAKVDIAKRTHGIVKGHSVEFKQGEGIIFAAEGIETGLSIGEVAPKGASVRAVLGVHNFANIEVEKGQQVVLCADNDGEGSPSEKALQKAVSALEEKGAIVHIMRPEYVGQDFNDVLKEEGSKGVAEYVKGAVEKIEQQQSPQYPEKDYVPAEFDISHLNDEAKQAFQEVDSLFPNMSEEWCDRVKSIVVHGGEEGMRTFEHLSASVADKQSSFETLFERLESVRPDLKEGIKDRLKELSEIDPDRSRRSIDELLSPRNSFDKVEDIESTGCIAANLDRLNREYLRAIDAVDFDKSSELGKQIDIIIDDLKDDPARI